MVSGTRQVIGNELAPDEELLWSGRPTSGMRLRVADLVLVPLSLLWCYFTLYGDISTLLEGEFGFYIRIPFLIFGLYLAAGRFVVDAAIRENTHYGITTERVIIVSGVLTDRIETLELAGLEEIGFCPSAEGRGVITFGLSHPMTSWLSGIPWPGMNRLVGPCFEMVENASSVHKTLMLAKRNLTLPKDERLPLAEIAPGAKNRAYRPGY